MFQDTCVALQALAQYAAGAFTGSYDLDIITTDVNNNFNHKFVVTENNKLLVQKVEIQNMPSDITFEASRNGCAVVQVMQKKPYIRVLRKSYYENIATANLQDYTHAKMRFQYSCFPTLLKSHFGMGVLL